MCVCVRARTYGAQMSSTTLHIIIFFWDEVFYWTCSSNTGWPENLRDLSVSTNLCLPSAMVIEVYCHTEQGIWTRVFMFV